MWSVILGALISLIGTLAVASYFFYRTTKNFDGIRRGLARIRDNLRTSTDRLSENADQIGDVADRLNTLAKGLEEAFRTGRVQFNRDDEGNINGVVIKVQVEDTIPLGDDVSTDGESQDES